MNHRNSRTDTYRWQAWPVPARIGVQAKFAQFHSPKRSSVSVFDRAKRNSSGEWPRVGSDSTRSRRMDKICQPKHSRSRCEQCQATGHGGHLHAGTRMLLPLTWRNTVISSGDGSFRLPAGDAARDLTGTQNKTNNSTRSGKISLARLA